MSLIKGIHHVSLKASNDAEYSEMLKFYGEVLGLELVRSWSTGAMFRAGESLMELGASGGGKADQGVIRHFAFAVDDVDACVKAVSDAGYEVFMSPKDIELPSDPVFPATVAFCYGPLGEQIEFFRER